jgi:hypothetical protein
MSSFESKCHVANERTRTFSSILLATPKKQFWNSSVEDDIHPREKIWKTNFSGLHGNFLFRYFLTKFVYISWFQLLRTSLVFQTNFVIVKRTSLIFEVRFKINEVRLTMRKFVWKMNEDRLKKTNKSMY